MYNISLYSRQNAWTKVGEEQGLTQINIKAKRQWLDVWKAESYR